MRFIVENHLEEILLRRNQAALASNSGNRGKAHASKGDTKGTVVPRNGNCTKWAKAGECAAGKKCPWAASHTEENRGWNHASKGKGKGKKGKDRKKTPSPSGQRGRSPHKEQKRGSTPPKGGIKPGASPARKRGKSPSGEVDKPPCFRYLKGNCKDPNCKWWHPPPCRDFKAGNCSKNKCEFLHATEKVKAAIKANKDSAQARCARFTSFQDDLPELIDDEPNWMVVPKGGAKASAGFFVEDPAPQVRVARIYILKVPKFSAQDVRKAASDGKALPDQPRNSKFQPHRTDEEGNVCFDDQDTIEQNEEWSRKKALRLREELEPDTDGDSFFIPGSEIRKVYSFRSDPASPDLDCMLSKAQKRRKRKREKNQAGRKHSQEEESSAQARPSSQSGPRPRRYIVDSGASFHLVDPRTLTRKEQQKVEDIEVPIPIETANGEVAVTQRCRVLVIELNLYICAFLHVDTVCVLSLGLLVDRDGFTYHWKPGKAPELKKGKLCVACYPHFSVPFIYASHTRGNPFACPSKSSVPSLDEVVSEEMEGLEDLIPPVPSLGGKDEGATSSDAGGNSTRGTPRRKHWVTPLNYVLTLARIPITF